MIGSLGTGEILLLFVVALLVFGPRKLPELGKSLGRGLSEFRKASNELRNTLEEEVRAEDDRGKRGKLRLEPPSDPSVNAARVAVASTSPPETLATGPGSSTP